MAVTEATQAELAQIRAEVNAALDARRIAATAQWEASWGRMADRLGAWADAWAEIAEEALKRGRNPYRQANLHLMRQLAEDELRGNLDVIGRLDRETLGRLVVQAEGHAARLAGSQIPRASRGALPWLPTAPDAMAAVVDRTTQQITARHYYLSQSAKAAVRSALRVGMAAGDNPRRVARDMIRRTEGAFNGGLWRAEVIARTELLDAHRAAAQQAELANRDVLSGWQWLAELTARTCPACLGMNGSEHPVEEAGPLDHQCGRCSRVPLVRPLKELGIGGPEPASVVQDSEAWLKAQSPEVQREILGPKRYEAYQAGKFPRERWAQRHSTEGWRDSYRVGKPEA